MPTSSRTSSKPMRYGLLHPRAKQQEQQPALYLLFSYPWSFSFAFFIFQGLRQLQHRPPFFLPFWTSNDASELTDVLGLRPLVSFYLFERQVELGRIHILGIRPRCRGRGGGRDEEEHEEGSSRYPARSASSFIWHATHGHFFFTLWHFLYSHHY